jgi:hypothetical protein
MPYCTAFCSLVEERNANDPRGPWVQRSRLSRIILWYPSCFKREPCLLLRMQLQ